MTKAEHKEANRYFWIVKGHLIPDSWQETEIMSVYDGYFDRIWGKHENCVHEDGFEEAYTKKCFVVSKTLDKLCSIEYK